MKLCCTSVMLPRWTLDETFDKLAECGYDAVELRCRYNPDEDSAPAFWGRHLSDGSPDNIVDKAPAIRAAACGWRRWHPSVVSGGGRADQQAVSAAAGDFNGALGVVLPADFRKVDRVTAVFPKNVIDVEFIGTLAHISCQNFHRFL